MTRTRIILHPRAQQGWFRYGTRKSTSSAVAAANGQTATFDPTIQKLLADIRAATGTTGTITDNVDPRFQNYNYNVAIDVAEPVSDGARGPQHHPSQRWSTTFN